MCPFSLRDEADRAMTLPLPAETVHDVETPAFVIDERRIVRRLERAARLRDNCGCMLLYTLKPLSLGFVLELMKPWVDGFATSSLFESRLARSVCGNDGTVHITTPGFRPHELAELSASCDHVAFNSLSQLERFGGELGGPNQVGLRVNPQLSLVDDERYDPCRRHSKLGVSLDELRRQWRRRPELLAIVGGLHFHTNCEATTFGPLRRTILRLEKYLGKRLPHLQWINLGGGYRLGSPARAGLLARSVRRLRRRYGLTVYIEPGTALVADAGYLVTTVIDLFKAEGQAVAVLDTTVNHVPEVFEYQFEPDVLGHVDDGDHEYLLAGSSCLAGDLLGVYTFELPLSIGSRIVLANVGAYTMVKAHMFNGINLPTVYSVSPDGQLVLRRRYTYEDFLERSPASSHASV
jgi:carboxynorspermidine decarboxylase